VDPYAVVEDLEGVSYLHPGERAELLDKLGL